MEDLGSQVPPKVLVAMVGFRLVGKMEVRTVIASVQTRRTTSVILAPVDLSLPATVLPAPPPLHTPPASPLRTRPLLLPSLARLHALA